MRNLQQSGQHSQSGHVLSLRHPLPRGVLRHGLVSKRACWLVVRRLQALPGVPGTFRARQAAHLRRLRQSVPPAVLETSRWPDSQAWLEVQKLSHVHRLRIEDTGSWAVVKVACPLYCLRLVLSAAQQGASVSHLQQGLQVMVLTRFCFFSSV